LPDFSEAIRLNPSMHQAWNNRGLAYFNRGQADLALADMNEALRLNPKYSYALSNRGLIHRARGQTELAYADYDAAIRSNPNYAKAHSNRASLAYSLKDYDKALASLNEAIRIEPLNPVHYANRGNVHREKGDRERARADYRRVLELPTPTKTDVQRQANVRERLARLDDPALSTRPSLRRVALVIGNSSYQHAGPLENPRHDAKEIGAALRRLGFEHVAEYYDLTLDGMTRAFKEFGDRTQQAEWALVFFAGHGLELGGMNYLIPVDAELKRDVHVLDEAISLERVLSKIDGAGKLGLVILDACRNNPFLARMARTGGGTRSLGRGLGALEPDGNVMIAYSAKHGTVALDGTGKHSPYTEALLAHIEEPGLEVNLLFRRVRDTVRMKTARKQEPFVYGSLGSEELYFRNPAVKR
jgi:tetratricopeptide (TPR) repeat protein